MANLSNINNKFLFTDGDFLKIGNLAPINNISGTESGISITNSNVASITLDNTAASGKRYIMYSSGNGSLVFWDGDAGSARLQIDSSGNSTFAGQVIANGYLTVTGSVTPQIFMTSTTAGTPNWTLIARNDGYFLLGRAGVSNDFYFDPSGNATFGGNVTLTTANTDTILTIGTSASGGIDWDIQSASSSSPYAQSAGDLLFRNASSNVLRLGNNGSATFASTIDAGGRIKVSGGSTDQYYFEGARTGVGVTYRLYDNANNIYHDSWSAQVIRLNQNGGSGGNFLIMGGDVGIGTSPIEKLQVKVDDSTNDSFQGINVWNNATSGARAGISFKCYDWVQSAIWHGRSSTAAYAGALVLGTNPNTSDLTVSGVTGRMWILNNGRVGIGTSSPGNLLDVAGDTDISGQLFVQHSGSYTAKLKQLATSMSNATYTFEIDSTAHTSNMSTAGAMSVDVDSGRAFTINGLGNVGMGTTSPAAGSQLTLRSSASTGMTILSASNTGECFINFSDNDDANVGQIFYGHSPDRMAFRVGDDTRMTILGSNGNVGIKTTGPTNPLNINFSPNGIANITTGNNSTAWNTSSAIMLNGASNSNGLGFGVSGTANDRKSWIQSGHPQQQYANYLGALAINPLGGDVGIGTSSPTAKLDINGTVRYRGNTYSQLTYQVSGNYSANTWYTIATTATLTEQGIYILVAYVEDFTAGGSNYYIHACSTNFFWDRTSTNRTTAFNFPALLGTGHATGSLPLIRITQELGTAGSQSKIQWQTPYTYTGLNPGLSGKKLVFYFKRIGG